MYYLAENLEVRRAEFIERIRKLTGCDVLAAEKEVDLTLQRLFHWAAYSDKYGGTVQVVPGFCDPFHLCEHVNSIKIPTTHRHYFQPLRNSASIHTSFSTFSCFICCVLLTFRRQHFTAAL